MFSGGEKNSCFTFSVIGKCANGTLTQKIAVLFVPIIAYAFSE
jgi:hypothetical protein